MPIIPCIERRGSKNQFRGAVSRLLLYTISYKSKHSRPLAISKSLATLRKNQSIKFLGKVKESLNTELVQEEKDICLLSRLKQTKLI